MRDRVQQTIERYEMIRRGDRVLVAVSGGVDSMTLLALLRELQEELDLSLTVAHLDHQMRRGSAEDARTVIGQAEMLGLPVIHRDIDVPGYIRDQGLSPEQGAREVRYCFFQEAATEVGASVVALGHNLDDRVETFLINLMRGAGLEGLAGMPPVRHEGDIRYVRPLIDCSRQEIHSFASHRGIKYRDDPTNRDPQYLRNRVRRELLPLLRELNPNVHETVGRATETLRRTNEYLRQLARHAYEQALVDEGPGEIALHAGQLKQHGEPIRRYVIREAIRRVKGNLQEIGAVHLEDVLNQIEKGHSGNRIDLPGGVQCRYQGQQVVLTRRPTEEPPPRYCFPLEIGANRLDEIGWRFDLEVLQGSHPTTVEGLEGRIDCTKMVEPLVVRNRRPGDRFEPFGFEGTKKLQDFFVDEKVPREKRDKVPLMCDRKGILWVVGYRWSERARVTAETRQTLRVRAKPLDPEGREGVL